jgi:hypothetical protein
MLAEASEMVRMKDDRAGAFSPSHHAHLISVRAGANENRQTAISVAAVQFTSFFIGFFPSKGFQWLIMGYFRGFTIFTDFNSHRLSLVIGRIIGPFAVRTIRAPRRSNRASRPA